ncbi:MAG: helix-turn-helix transcriptional regulator [Pseudomonadota bacterium]
MHSFDEFSKIAPFSDAVRWQGKAGTAQIGLREMRLSPGSIDNPPAADSVLILYHSPARIRHQISGDKRPCRQFVPGDMLLRPPNLDWSSTFEDPVEVTVVALESGLVQSATTEFQADVGEVFGRLDARPFREPMIEGLARRLVDGAKAGSDRLYADALTFALIHELWRKADGTVPLRETKPGALTPQALRQLDEAITEAPGGQVSIDGLAAMLNMSMTAFAAAMKETTGQTPYQYVLSRRLAAASVLVETTQLSIAEVAYRCGFSSQSHMTDVFRAKIGTTPGRLRTDRV